MGKKKPFIDKKNAQHFNVVHRSQRDPRFNDPTASKFVLLSSKEPVEYDDQEDGVPELISTPAQDKNGFGAKDHVNEFGIPNDGYDYRQHMREIGSGTFYSAKGRFQGNEDLLSRRVEIPEESLPSLVENDRQLESIAISEDVMDDDLREALINDAAFEEMDDNFILHATEENEEEINDGFDYDAHIAKLLNAACNITDTKFQRPDEKDSFSDDEEVESDCSDLEDSFDEETDERNPLLDDMLEQVLKEYDDDEIGELDEDETRGKYDLEGELLDSIIDDYTIIQQEILDEQGLVGNPFSSGRNKLKQIIEECSHNMDSSDEEETQSNSCDDRIVGSYVVHRPEDKWDCQTILSTYSTLDNHPTIIDGTGSKKKKQTNRIDLSRKTGMPLGILDSHSGKENSCLKNKVCEEDQLFQPVKTLSITRKQGETKEEKKLRKAQIKENQRERKSQKKSVKSIYKQEEKKQLREQNANTGSIFKY